MRGGELNSSPQRLPLVFDALMQSTRKNEGAGGSGGKKEVEVAKESED